MHDSLCLKLKNQLMEVTENQYRIYGYSSKLQSYPVTEKLNTTPL